MEWKAVFTGLLVRVDHRRGSWGSASELGYQECSEKQALCQSVGVSPQAAERSGTVGEPVKPAHQNAKLVGIEETKSEATGHRKESWSEMWEAGTRLA